MSRCRTRRRGLVTTLALVLLVAAPAAAAAAPSKPAIWDDGRWLLRDSVSGGDATSVFRYGSGTAEIPVMGDWDGDGDETVGVVRWRPGVSDTLTWYLRDDNSGGANTVPAFSYGVMTFVAVDQLGTIPVAGDWDGDGVDTAGVVFYDQSTSGGMRWRLRNSNTGGPADLAYSFSNGRDRPVVGDWDGDGDDTPGVFRQPNVWHLRNSNSGGVANISFPYGSSDPGVIELPIVGDWDDDGDDTPGVLRNIPATKPDGGFPRWLLRNANSGGAADISFVYGSDAFFLGLPIDHIPRLAYR
jgi:hypothetical protein